MSLRGEENEGELKLGTITVSSLAAIVGKACSSNGALDRRMVAMSGSPSGFKLENNFISSPRSQREVLLFASEYNPTVLFNMRECAARVVTRRTDGKEERKKERWYETVRLECERQLGRRIGRVRTNGSIN